MTLRKDKCMFAMPEVEYLGYEITKVGLKISGNKVKAITKEPEPKNLSVLIIFLGTMQSFYRNCLLFWLPCILLLGKVYRGNG